MKVSSNIDNIIKYLQQLKEKGYTEVILVDDIEASGWHQVEPTIEFIFSKQLPKTVGIEARTKK